MTALTIRGSRQCRRSVNAGQADWKVSIFGLTLFLDSRAVSPLNASGVRPNITCPIGRLITDMAMSQALALTSDLKLGWYTSVPPREMFACQILGTILGCFANCKWLVAGYVRGELTEDVTLVSVIGEKRPFLDGTVEDPTGQWTGRSPGIFYSASIVWGAVSPKRFFSGGYEVLYLGYVIPSKETIEVDFSFVLGAVVPIVCWLAHKRWPGYKLHKASLNIEISMHHLMADRLPDHLQWRHSRPAIVRLPQ